jgi:glycosyltransferase involved in cell wall biosynthesis
MKILITADPELPVPPGLYGGIERIVDVLIHGYLNEGHSVTLCANGESKVPCELVAWKGPRSQSMVDTIKNTFTLSKLVLTRKFDVIHSFSRLAYMAPVLSLKTPKIMSYQREPSISQISKAQKLARKGSLVFTGCSNYITDQIKKVAEAYTIYNCAPFEKYNTTTAVADDAPLVFLGRIEDIKGTYEAIQVAQKTNRRLIIAGNVPASKEQYFEQKVKPFLNDRITYCGPVNDEQKNKLLGDALAFLMPIQWNEPFGIVMAESMACGTPVLGFPRGSVPEVVEDGVTGFKCKDVDDMARRVNDIASLNRAQVKARAAERFSNTKIVQDYLQLYSNLIGR